MYKELVKWLHATNVQKTQMYFNHDSSRLAQAMWWNDWRKAFEAFETMLRENVLRDNCK